MKKVTTHGSLIRGLDGELQYGLYWMFANNFIESEWYRGIGLDLLNERSRIFHGMNALLERAYGEFRV